MPPPLLLDLNEIDLDKVVLTRSEIYEYLPHRHEFALLDGVCHLDRERALIVGFRDVRADDWWFRGHVPGRPLLPGVLMLEMAAHAAALISKIVGGVDAFIGLGGVDNFKFRDAVIPPARLHLVAIGRQLRARRTVCDTQGVADGRLVFEGRITGLAMR